MKYVVHLRPQGEFCALVEDCRKQFNDWITKISDLEIHTTLMTVYADPKKEEDMIRVLNVIDFSPLTLHCGSLDFFDNDSLVIRIDQSEELCGLHKKVIDSLQEFISWEKNPQILEKYEGDHKRTEAFHKYGNPYCGAGYNPHVTIARINPELLKQEIFNTDTFKDKTWTADTIYLSKHEADKWSTVAAFSQK